MGYPVTVYFWGSQHGRKGGFGLGGTNATGQIASWGEVRHSLIDADTPKAAMTKVSLDGKTRMNLVFSDEFNVDGRSFVSAPDVTIFTSAVSPPLSSLVNLLTILLNTSMLATIRFGKH